MNESKRLDRTAWRHDATAMRSVVVEIEPTVVVQRVHVLSTRARIAFAAYYVADYFILFFHVVALGGAGKVPC